MRDITKLHPELQKILPQFIAECQKQGLAVKIGECVRTMAEQNEKYAQGRTTPGTICTNCKGSTYSSLHQWGVAFDFYLDMDIDGDGSKKDDAFNDSKGTFIKIGKIGKKLGLAWGGDFRSIHDSPHFQMKKFSPDDTSRFLKARYGTPDKFMANWK